MLRLLFPNSDKGAEIYGGKMHHRNCFIKYFNLKSNILESLNSVNEFLVDNAYDSIDISQLDETNCYNSYPITLTIDEFKGAYILSIDRDQASLTQESFLKSIINKFVEERDWNQFHNPKDLAIAINIETSELLEKFLWKKSTEVAKEELEDELADILIYSLLLANKLNIDIEEIILKKISKNIEKYPVEKAKGISTKYNKL